MGERESGRERERDREREREREREKGGGGERQFIFFSANFATSNFSLILLHMEFQKLYDDHNNGDDGDDDLLSPALV